MTNEELSKKWNLDVYPECQEGWMGILDTLLTELAKVPGWKVSYIQQIKEKYGGLRFYHDFPDFELVECHVRVAEAESLRTCEVCGQPGIRGGKGWIQTLCGEHRAKS